MKSYV
jgi:hypothetical protein